MTDSPQRPDPLSPGFDPGASTPDPSADRWSAFDEPADQPAPMPTPSPTPSATPSAATPSSPYATPYAGSPVPGQPGQPGQPGGPGTTAPWMPPGPVRRRGSGASRAVVSILAVIGVLTVAFVALVVLVATKSSDSDTSSRADRTALPLAPVSVEPSSVPAPPAAPTRVRVEIQGAGRVVDLRVYQDGSSTRLDSVTLPYAVELTVDPADTYLTVDADDYGYRGAQAMSCTVTAGGVELSRSVGTQSVGCDVTHRSWRIGR